MDPETTKERDQTMITLENQDKHLRKGKWTSSEDGILRKYITEHGEGEWKSVETRAGINRSAESCRLRWRNHLGPNLRKGALTPAEKLIVIDLHAQLGNKWAKIAKQLPGRTDNEVKNYVNAAMRKAMRKEKAYLDSMSHSLSQL